MVRNLLLKKKTQKCVSASLSCKNDFIILPTDPVSGEGTMDGYNSLCVPDLLSGERVVKW